uniref:TIGR00645 family protein n=1 Tax=Candidatus Kentrum sp. FM TaxID=2126340 RepID=A0A450S7N2_9GAMM|nr:MAG: TIGR00645 family protein [Candidatus Kentron sp. FM]VFJ48021.1 MAG: TIGR00645 family protein [Candidatus Kentron sp. FM]VFK07682.1 MAG: TIGR00645 family protein [Candidatus Kentron sp. FM]
MKLKIAASIVAVSSIHLLRAFMDIEQISNDKPVWYVLIHLTFVIPAVAMGYLSKMMSH